MGRTLMRLFGCLLVVAAASCAEGQPQKEASSTSGTTTAPASTIGTTTGPAVALDVLRKDEPAVVDTSLRRIRRLADKLSKEDQALTGAANEVTGIAVEVRCWSGRGWSKVQEILEYDEGDDVRLAGLIDPYSFEIHLAPDICADLTVLRSGSEPQDLEQEIYLAEAMVVLTHEAMHATPAGGDEARVECYAIQEAYRVGMGLGLDEDYARALASLYWEHVYPTHSQEYRSPKCRDGEAYDRHPETNEWP